MWEPVSRHMKQQHLLLKTISVACQFCVGCCECRLTRKPIPSVTSHQRGRADRPLNRLHADLVGPKRTQTNRNRYFVLITDEFSAYRWVIQGSTKTALIPDTSGEASTDVILPLGQWQRIHQFLVYGLSPKNGELAGS